MATKCPQIKNSLTIHSKLGSSRRLGHHRHPRTVARPLQQLQRLPLLHVLYPSNHFTYDSPHTRSLLLINTNISTDAYFQLDILSSYITAIQILGLHGPMFIFNIYNDCHHNDSLTITNNYLSAHPPTPLDTLLWLGDFNRHHPLWESPNNRHFNSSEDSVHPLLDLLRDYDLELALPLGIPTFETSMHNWTRPDNVWLSHHALNLII